MVAAQVVEGTGYIALNSDTDANSIVTSIIIPAYNEETGLPLVLSALTQIIGKRDEIIVVDDGSHDNSSVVAEQFPCRVIRHTVNQGKGAAMRTGLLHARGKYVIFVDADNTYPVEYIPKIAALLDRYDFVRGIRLLGRENIPFTNRFGNLLFDVAFRMLHSIDEGDVLSGMYGIHREALMKFNIMSKGFDIETEIVAKVMAHGLSYTTIPITYSERVGEKKLKALRDGSRILESVLAFAITYNPSVAVIVPGIFLTVVALLGLFMTISGSWLRTRIPLSANATFLFGFLAVLGFQIIILGLAVYEVGRIFGINGHRSAALEFIRTKLRVRKVVLGAFLSSVIGLLIIIILSFNWWGSGYGEFNHTFILVLGSLLTVVGLQIASAAVFLSALRKLQQVSNT